MRPFVRPYVPFLAAACLVACSDGDPSSPAATTDAGGVSPEGGTVVEGDYTWHLPPGFPKPKVPADNPMSKAKVDLGQHLFYDTRLSGNQTYACASCHEQAKAFTDGRARAVGATGETHPRGAMSLANVGYASALTWANSLMTSLELQAMVPMFNETPVELGLAGKDADMLARLRAEPRYQTLFPRAFPGEADPFTLEHVVQALSTFERTLLSGNSPYDRSVSGADPNALSASAKRGSDLFFSERLECFHCHGSFNFADSMTHEGVVFTEVAYHNTGLYNIDGKGAYPPDNTGLVAISGNPSDMGRFRAPTLRNIAVTAPYMHDGSVATLDEALDHYAAGGRQITSGPYAGDGSKNPYKSEFVRGFLMTPEEKEDVVHFLESLTDDQFLHDPQYGNPWTQGEGEP